MYIYIYMYIYMYMSRYCFGITIEMALYGSVNEKYVRIYSTLSSNQKCGHSRSALGQVQLLIQPISGISELCTPVNL